jgi:opacity protein-like surface antigen
MKHCALIAMLFCVLLASAASADHLPPVDPILSGTDHIHENHDGHNHFNTDIRGDFTGASFRGANLKGSFLRSDPNRRRF